MGYCKLLRTDVPNNFEPGGDDSEPGSTLQSIFNQNQTSDLSGLTYSSDGWLRSINKGEEGSITPSRGKNYTNTDPLQFICEGGIDFYNTIFQGTALLLFKAQNNKANSLFSLIVNPFNCEYFFELDKISGSIFEARGGAFISGVIDFTQKFSQPFCGIRGHELGNPFFLLSCEQFIDLPKNHGS